MVDRIIPPVNSTITIQPLATTAASQQESSPQALQGVAAGTLVEGFVVNRDAQQNPILRTILGDILVKSEIFLKTGSDVVVRVEPAQPGLARIISIDGMTPADYALKAQSGAVVNDEILTSLFLPPAQGVATGTAATPAAFVRVAGLVITPPKPLADLLPAALQARWTQMVNLLPANTPLTVTITAAAYPPAAPAAPATPTTTPSQPPLIPQPFAPILPPPDSSAPITPRAALPPAPFAVSSAPLLPVPPPIISPAAVALPASPAGAASVSTTPVSARAVPPIIPSPALPTASVPTSPATSPAAPIVTATAAATPILPGILSANDYTAPALPTATQNVSPRYPQPFAAIATVDLATPHPATQTAAEPLPWLRGEVNRLMVAAGEGQGKSAAPAPMQPLFTNLRAEVIGNEPGGGNFVQTAIGTLYIKTAQILPPGTTLTLTLAPQAPDTLPAPLAPLLPEAIDDFTILAREWTSLKNLFTALGTIDPSLAAALADRILPKPHAKLTNEMLFFLAAIKKGDVSEWLGRHARDVLADRAPETLDRLARDFLQLQQAITEPKTQGWTGLVIPFLTQGQLQQMRLYMKQDEASGGKRGESAGQRFIMELELSVLGDMQLDGFIKSREVKKEFDLIIRSARHLPQEITQNIRQIFEQSLSITGMQGYLGFQEGREHFLTPLSEARSGEAGGSGNSILA